MTRLYSFLTLFTQLSMIETTDDSRPIPLINTRSGDTIILQCLNSNSEHFQTVYWFKQSLGCMLQMVAGKNFYDKNNFLLNDNDSRYSMEMLMNRSTLTIKSITKADEATYFCMAGSAYRMEGKNATFLAVREYNYQRSNYLAIPQPPVSKLSHPRDSVDLQCSVLSKTCPGEHSVYWFRAGSGESHPGIIYTNRNRGDECEQNPETSSSTQSCTYSLPRNRLNSSDDGTYYCAVAICGEILFGRGTTLETSLKSVVVGLGIALIGCGIAILILTAITITRSRKTLREYCKDPIKSNKCLPRGNSTAEQDGDADMLNYAALKFSDRKSRERKMRETQQESVYSDVRS